MRLNLPFAILVLLSLCGSAFAVDAPMRMEDAFKLSVDRSGPTATFRWEITKGYYLYRDALEANTDDGRKLDLQTPSGAMKDDPGFGSTEVYFDQVAAKLANAPVKLKVSFRGCQDGGICYPVRTVQVDGLRMASDDPLAPRPPDATAFKSFTPIPPSAIAETVQKPATPAGAGMVEGILSRGGMALLLASFVGLGMLLAFTPCVFPMYPILAATLGRQGTSLSPERGFFLSVVYVVALAAAFSLFGVLAAWLGQSFQIALQSRTAVGVMVGLFALLAIASFGMVEIQLPAFLRDRLARRQRAPRGTIGSTAVLGFTSALLLGPCVTAPLAGALLYIAKTGDIALGAAALFALGIGKGIPLIVIGTSGAALLPRAGAWMTQVRWLFGFMFLGTAVWYLDRLVEPSVTLGLSAAVLVTVGVCFGAFDTMPPGTGLGRRLVKSGSLLAILYGAFLAFGAASGATSMLQPLKRFGGSVATTSPGLSKASFASVSNEEELRSALAKSSKPSLVYFTADWCVSCHVIDRSVLSDPRVAVGLADTHLVIVDLSQMTPAKQKLMTDNDVVGPPTMLFFRSDASAADSLVGEISAQDVIDAAAKAAATAQSINSSRGAPS
ncbi:protein-disulfide reductase DsbD [Rhizobium lusitanum]|uniref:Thiol:disulfide interchange protein DsbD n=1 Tax=Rhizobium lusitanum TaxID=293958 RepID=A0A7X0IUC6_9HYPH|nr:protein-disulfide reductase DsbD [Rhizobium lusitanum]MBB6486822.1 thiol:disulfide interchange protein DsbD [Rhizobium lusitanum]